jgi:hypothetical protein
VVAAMVIMADDFSVKADEIDPHAAPGRGEAAVAAGEPEPV